MWKLKGEMCALRVRREWSKMMVAIWTGQPGWWWWRGKVARNWNEHRLMDVGRLSALDRHRPPITAILTCATRRTRTRLGDRSFSVAGTFCLLHYVTETSHLYSLRDVWRHFCLSRAVAHSDCCFFAPCTNIITYLLTYLLICGFTLRRNNRKYRSQKIVCLVIKKSRLRWFVESCWAVLNIHWCVFLSVSWSRLRRAQKPLLRCYSARCAAVLTVSDLVMTTAWT